VNVATVLPPLKLTGPATALPPESFTVNDTESGATACENVAVGAAPAVWIQVRRLDGGERRGVERPNGMVRSRSPSRS
jgi:hypothetical protein